MRCTFFLFPQKEPGGRKEGRGMAIFMILRISFTLVFEVVLVMEWSFVYLQEYIDIYPLFIFFKTWDQQGVLAN